MFWLWRLIWHVDLRGWVPEPSVRCGSECVWDAVFGGVALESGFWAIRGAPSRQLKASREHKEFLLPRGILVRTGSLSPLDLDLGCSVSSPWVSSLSAYGLEPGHHPPGSQAFGLRREWSLRTAALGTCQPSVVTWDNPSHVTLSIIYLVSVMTKYPPELKPTSVIFPSTYLPTYLPTCLPAYLAVCTYTHNI